MAGAIAVGTVFGAAGVANALTAQDDPAPDTTQSTVDDESTLEGDDSDAGEVGEGVEGDDDDARETADGVEVDDDDAGEHSQGTETPLTGSTADQVTAAALAAVPGGTIDRVENDDHGAAFEAHMTDADGNPVTVTFDENFAVVEIEQGH